MKLLVSTILILFYNSCIIYAQSGSIVYKIVNYRKEPISSIVGEKINKETLDMVLEAEQNKKLLEYELKFNKESSIFQLKNKVLYSDKSFEFAFLMTKNGRDKFYYDKRKNQRLTQIEYKGVIINVNTPKCDWQITNETKMIDKYKVTKGVCKTEYMDKTRNKLISGDRIAWFTYDIPLSFGPGGLDGLPGLILEGSLNKYEYFYASSINLENNIIKKIDLPKADKTMTQDELDQFMADDLKRMKGN